MNTAQYIREKIKSIPESEPFGYDNLGIIPADFNNSAKAIERLIKKGEIKKIAKGVFYRPTKSTFGELPPNYNSVLINFMFEGNKRTGYVTGFELYNQMGLTTQVSSKTTIATNRSRRKFKVAWLRATTVKAYVGVTDDNYRLLGILDALKDIKSIPAASPKEAIVRLIAIIKELSSEEIQDLINYALNYPPRVRALLGAIIEFQYKKKFNIEALKNSLNPSTSYKLGLNKSILSTGSSWNIV